MYGISSFLIMNTTTIIKKRKTTIIKPNLEQKIFYNQQNPLLQRVLLYANF